MSSEHQKQVMQAHFKVFRQQLEYLSEASVAHQKQRGASPFARPPPASTPDAINCKDSEELLPVVDLDYFEAALSELVSSTGGLSTPRAGGLFAKLVSGHAVGPLADGADTKGAPSHAVTPLHRALAVTVLQRTTSVAAMTSFLHAGGLKTVVKWLYMSSNIKDPPASLSLLQHILEWLTFTNAPNVSTNDASSPSASPPSPLSLSAASARAQSSSLLRVVHAAVDPPTATLLLDLSRRSEKLFGAPEQSRRCVAGFDHAVHLPGTRCEDREPAARTGLQASVLSLYRLLFTQLGDKMPMQRLSEVAVKAKTTPAGSAGQPKKRPLGNGRSLSGSSGSDGGDSPRSKKSKTGDVLNNLSNGSSRGGGSANTITPSADSVERPAVGSPRPSTSAVTQPPATEEAGERSPNRKVLHRSGRRRSAVDDLQVIVPFSTGDRNPGEASDMQADTAHNAARRKIKWGDEQAEGVLLQTREFVTLPPYEPTAEERRQEALKQGLSEESVELGAGLGGRGGRKRGLRGFAEADPDSPRSDGRKKRVAERERDPVALRRETAARQLQQDRLDAARAATLPPETVWVQPGPVTLSAEQQLLAGTIEVDSKERKLQTQRIGTKLEFFFTDKDIPPDPESSARTSHHLQLLAGATEVSIPWHDSAREMDSETPSNGQELEEPLTKVKGGTSRQPASTGVDTGMYDSFERQLRQPEEEAKQLAEADDLLSGLPAYVTMLDERQLEVLLELLSEPAHMHLLENSEHPDFLELVGRIAPAVKVAYLRQQHEQGPQQQQRGSDRPGGRRSRFSDGDRGGGSPRSDSNSAASSPPRPQYEQHWHHQSHHQQERGAPLPPRHFFGDESHHDLMQPHQHQPSRHDHHLPQQHQQYHRPDVYDAPYGHHQPPRQQQSQHFSSYDSQYHQYSTPPGMPGGSRYPEQAAGGQHHHPNHLHQHQQHPNQHHQPGQHQHPGQHQQYGGYRGGERGHQSYY
mmetsp:Transcript_11849/g.19294  ORF Transcript_11849/g.19294 Transcript_11849/m.19294 type:complete len:976 (+) Transcript_11849:203-3130(+)